jgi:uncharacterized membrane protein YkvA (DUF1232 family)
MKIDSLKIKVSWENLNKAAMEYGPDDFLREITIAYEEGIVLKLKIKGGMTFSIAIEQICPADGGLSVYIGKARSIITLPGFARDLVIKRFIGRMGLGEEGGIVFNEADNSILLTKPVLSRTLPFSDFNVAYVCAGREGLEMELTGAIVEGGKKACQEEGIEETLYIEDNDDIKLEENADMGRAEDYYTKIRSRINNYIKSGVPPRYHYLIPYILLLPDVLMLFIRLFRDSRVKASDKAMVLAGIIYIISPFDIIPDVVLPFGVLDDLGIGFFALDKLLLNVPEEVLSDNFDGEGDVIHFIRKGYSFIKNILPAVKFDKIAALFGKMVHRMDKSITG